MERALPVVAKKKTAKKLASKKKVTGQRVAKKKLVAKKRAAVKKKTVAKKKTAARKKIAVKKRATVKKKVAVKKKTAARKKIAVKKKAAVKKGAVKKGTAKKKPAPRTKIAKEKAPAKKKIAKKPPKRRGRVTKMTAAEAMISLLTLADRWEDLGWLEALYLYGNNLGAAAGHRELRFMVIFKGLRQATQQRVAEKELDKLLKPAIPVRRRLELRPDLEIIQWIEQENPAFVAAFGQAIPIYVRHPS